LTKKKRKTLGDDEALHPLEMFHANNKREKKVRGMNKG
jgi:hypothetical protein